MMLQKIFYAKKCNGFICWLAICFLAGCVTSNQNEQAKTFVGLKEMMFIKGGFFKQGNAAGTPAEKPVRTVALDDFYMDITPITYKDFKDYALLGGEKNAQWYDENYHKDDLPLTGLTWHQAADFCNWRSKIEGFEPVYELTQQYDSYGYPIFVRNLQANGYRLPTEAEFEYAASCGETQKVFPWGKEFSHTLANFDIERKQSKGKWRRLAPVRELHKNAWGLFGMSGNQWHWCDDWFDADEYSKNPTPYNPQGGKIGIVKSLRGGSWGSHSPVFLTVYKRSYTAAGGYNFDIGFRCVRPAKTAIKTSQLNPKITQNPTITQKPENENKITLKNTHEIQHNFYKEEKYHQIQHFKGDIYSAEFTLRLGRFIADYYPNSLYFYQKIDKQPIITPQEMAELIVEVTKQHNIHPLILTGIFAAESGFGSCSVPRWYNNPLAFHWQNKLIANGEPEYNAQIGLKNEKFATLRDNFTAFCQGIRKRFYIVPARKDLEAFHKLYVGYDAHAWMLPISKLYRDVLGIKIDAKNPKTEVGKLIYTDWEEFNLLLPQNYQ
jgi:sulfatase modifying factor 1